MRALASFLRNSLLCSSVRGLELVFLKGGKMIFGSNQGTGVFFSTGKGGSSFFKQVRNVTEFLTFTLIGSARTSHCGRALAMHLSA